MAEVLTKKKKRWAKQFKHTGLIKGKTLRYNAAVQDRYVKALVSLTKQMTSQTRREVEKFFKAEHAREHFGMDADPASQARILTNSLMDKFQQLFSGKAKGLADSMARDADRASSAALHASLKEMSGGLSLPTSAITGPMQTIIKASVAENVGLIKSIPQQYLQNVQGALLRSIIGGAEGGPDLVTTLFTYLDEEEGRAIRRARNIGIDQTRKAYNNMNKGRMQKLGVEKFEWIHSGGGQKPRPLHVAMSGNIYSFDNLPVIDENTGERGIPGQAINCGCTMRPVVSFDGGEQTDDTDAGGDAGGSEEGDDDNAS